MSTTTPAISLHQAIAEMTPASLAAWLESTSQWRRFLRGSCYYCLIARYLQSITDRAVEVDEAYARCQMEKVDLPIWVQSAITEFDATPTMEIGVSESLQILRRVCPEIGERGR